MERFSWWLDVKLPNPREYVVSVGVWSPDDVILVTNEAVYRLDGTDPQDARIRQIDRR